MYTIRKAIEVVYVSHITSRGGSGTMQTIVLNDLILGYNFYYLPL